MSDQFTRVGRALPTISNMNQLQQYLATWKNSLGRPLRRPVPPPPPFNFKATNARGGIRLSWSPGALNQSAGGTRSAFSSGAPDGYEILKSSSGDFASDLTIIPVRDPASSQFFDAVGGPVQTFSYRIRTTAGTSTSPYAQHGPESGVVKHSSIDSNDTVTTPTSKQDVYMNDQVRSSASRGKYDAHLSGVVI